jgi:RimJ/RimL family protein N-acetyltransferase
MSRQEATLALRTARLELHFPTDSDRDAALMLAVLNDPDFMHHVRDSGVRDVEGARAALRAGAMAYRQANGIGMCRITETASGRDLGQIGLVSRPGLPAPDLGYALLPHGRGQGFAVEAGRAVLTHARDSLQLPQVLAIVHAGHTASEAVLAKLGFGFETMMWLPGIDHELQLFSIALQKDT